MATPNIKIEFLKSVDLNSLNTIRIDQIPVLPVKCTFNSIGGYYSDRTADVFFKFVEGGQIIYLAGHRCILASDSEKFRQIFYETAVGSIVKICDTSLELFDLLLQSFYNRSVLLRIHQIDELTRLAFYYNANKCKQICIDYMKTLIEDDNLMILHCLELALRHDCVNIQTLCLAKIQKYGHGLVHSPEFFAFSWQVIKTVLTVNFYGRDEFELFIMCLNQATFECKRDHLDANDVMNVKKYLKKYLTIIRLRDLTFENISEIIKTNTVDYDDIKPYLDDDSQAKNANSKRPPEKLSTGSTIISAIKIKDPMMSFRRIHGDEQTADLKLTFQNCTVSLHCCILAAKGLSLAKAIYNGNLKGHWTIGHMKIVADFFKPFYGVSIAINIDTVLAATQFGKYFQIDEYENMDFQPLLLDALTVGTAFQIYELATYFDYYEIINKCCILFKSSTFVWSEALNTESFYSCNPKTINFAFRYGKLNSSVLFETVIEWAKYQCQQQKLNPITPQTIRAMIGDVNRWILTEMDGEHVLNALNKYSDIFSDDDLQMISKTLKNRSQ